MLYKNSTAKACSEKGRCRFVA